mmetsp:Transcript_12929/g.14572  ORF Transcript_12929/g.14572 Transcript_12929/m.14572 type:complete len:229 (-) Transcript_12929:138-824(-)
MNTDDAYCGREDLLTATELDELDGDSSDDDDYDSSDDEIPTYTPNIKSWLFDFTLHKSAIADAEDQDEFKKRPPALGVTQSLIDETREHEKLLTPPQKRELYGTIKHRMLRVLIPCSGVESTGELLDILEKELKSGKPSPVPDWYEFAPARGGPRKIGYDECQRRECYETESFDKKFARCSNCKQVTYCSRACQVTDWKARHKQNCKQIAKHRDDMAKAFNFQRMFMG